MSELKLTERDLESIRKALAGLQFGSIEITVHNSRIVQIERKEKVRLEGGTKGGS